jgi:hypothetical protein
LGERSIDKVKKVYTPEDLQLVQRYEDKANAAIMILEANNDVLTSLKEYYERLIKNDDFPLRDSCKNNIVAFSTQINDMVYDSKMQIKRARLLVKLAGDTKVLVLQHLQTQATQTIERLTEMSYKETVVMRVVTVVTLIYLPATFVSTFFSTDIIKYQNQSGQGTFSAVALNRWLQVTLPLTAVTLLAGFCAYKLAKSKAESDRAKLFPLLPTSNP